MAEFKFDLGGDAAGGAAGGGFDFGGGGGAAAGGGFSLDLGGGGAAAGGGFSLDAPAGGGVDLGGGAATGGGVDLAGGGAAAGGGFSLDPTPAAGGAPKKAAAPPTISVDGGGAGGGLDLGGFGAAAGGGAAGGGLDFGGLGEAAKPAAAAPSTTKAAAGGGGVSSAVGGGGAVQLEDVTSKIKDKTIAEILEMWEEGLETHVAAFKDEAEVLKQWDARLKDNFDNIKRVETDIESVQVAQLELSKKLEGIHTTQETLSRAVHNLNTLYEAEKGKAKAAGFKATPDDLKREHAYNMAEKIDSELMMMSRRCNETIKTLSESTGIDRDEDVKNPLAHVLKVLNYQMTSLKWVEQTSNSLTDKLRVADRDLKRRQSHLAHNGLNQQNF